MAYELEHLRQKLKTRDPNREKELTGYAAIEPHPIFHIIPGEISPWEKL